MRPCRGPECCFSQDPPSWSRQQHKMEGSSQLERFSPRRGASPRGLPSLEVLQWEDGYSEHLATRGQWGLKLQKPQGCGKQTLMGTYTFSHAQVPAQVAPVKRGLDTSDLGGSILQYQEATGTPLRTQMPAWPFPGSSFLPLGALMLAGTILESSLQPTNTRA